MIVEPAHVQLAHKSWDVRQSPVDPAQLLLTIILTATTGLSPADVDAIKDRIIRDGFKLYVTGSVDTQMLDAMRLSLLRAEEERDQNRTRADRFEAELLASQARVRALEEELEKNRRMYGFLEQGLPRA
jgi:hypothetical protein